jgi:hypothetical protein
MPNLNYILPRVIRHFLPDAVVDYLLKHSLIIQPGLETLSPEKAVERYIEKLKLHKLSLVGKRVMIFGYGLPHARSRGATIGIVRTARFLK